MYYQLSSWGKILTINGVEPPFHVFGSIFLSAFMKQIPHVKRMGTWGVRTSDIYFSDWIIKALNL